VHAPQLFVALQMSPALPEPSVLQSADVTQSPCTHEPAAHT
jgi:hypothetical protein